MSKKNVLVILTPSGVQAAIDILKAEKRSFEYKALQFRHAVALRTMDNAKALYAKAWYNDWVRSGPDKAMVPVIVEETRDASIVVAGYPAIFIEFGAGIHHNGGTIFASPHPHGLKLGFTIGSYPGVNGVPSWGQYDQWYVKDRGDFTKGTDAQYVLYQAVRYTMPDIEEIAKEIFDD